MSAQDHHEKNAHSVAVVDEAMVERAEAARERYWETDSNFPETDAEWEANVAADPAHYDKKAMRAALEAAITGATHNG